MFEYKPTEKVLAAMHGLYEKNLELEKAHAALRGAQRDVEEARTALRGAQRDVEEARTALRGAQRDVEEAEDNFVKAHTIYEEKYVLVRDLDVNVKTLIKEYENSRKTEVIAQMNDYIAYLEDELETKTANSFKGSLSKP